MLSNLEHIKRKMERYCIYQERFHKEVESKLCQMQLNEKEREDVVIHLINHDFLNEERFALSFVRGKFNIKKYGKIRLIRELEHREVSEYCIKKAIEQIGQHEYLQALEKLYLKRKELLRGEEPKTVRQKIFSHLVSKGYEVHLITEILQKQRCANVIAEW